MVGGDVAAEAGATVSVEKKTTTAKKEIASIAADNCTGTACETANFRISFIRSITWPFADDAVLPVENSPPLGGGLQHDSCPSAHFSPGSIVKQIKRAGPTIPTLEIQPIFSSCVN